MTDGSKLSAGPGVLISDMAGWESDQYSNRRLLSIVNRHWSVGREDNEERGTENAEREGGSDK